MASISVAVYDPTTAAPRPSRRIVGAAPGRVSVTLEVEVKIATVYIRFYKSFNFDYLRKYSGKAEAEPWEMLNGSWQPYVRIPLHAELTAVVGANESGKSHLLSAIAKSLGGEELGFADFCRYSGYFSVEEGQMRRPDIGLHLAELTAAERAAVSEAVGTSLGSRESSRGWICADPGWWQSTRARSTRGS